VRVHIPQVRGGDLSVGQDLMIRGRPKLWLCEEFFEPPLSLRRPDSFPPHHVGGHFGGKFWGSRVGDLRSFGEADPGVYQSGARCDLVQEGAPPVIPRIVEVGHVLEHDTPVGEIGSELQFLQPWLCQQGARLVPAVSGWVAWRGRRVG
jgi:hypothetical protein